MEFLLPRKPAYATTPKVVVFDLGKVLVDFDYRIAARALAANGQISAEEIRAFVTQSNLLIEYETGLLTSEEFFRQVCKATGYGCAFGEFARCFSDIFTPIDRMIGLQSDLRKQGIPSYIFSNTNALAIDHIRRHFPFFANFDDYILSYEHRAMKPDHKLYEVVETRCGQRGADILYVDDRPENIATGVARGWQVILQESPEKTIRAVRELGLLNGS